MTAARPVGASRNHGLRPKQPIARFALAPVFIALPQAACPTADSALGDGFGKLWADARLVMLRTTAVKSVLWMMLWVNIITFLFQLRQISCRVFQRRCVELPCSNCLGRSTTRRDMPTKRFDERHAGSGAGLCRIEGTDVRI